MQVSVVVCTHEPARYDALAEAADSVLEGTYDDVELVLVSDGSESVRERMERDYGDHPAVRVETLTENRGLLAARNAGASAASGEFVAFLDDDAVAHEDWLARLMEAVEARDRLAVGGRMVPKWVAGRPDFLPEEFYFLIGVVGRGFGPGGNPDTEGEVRNGFGSNIAFDAEVFAELGGFEPDVGGRKGDKQLQGGETELSARFRAMYGEGVWYVPDAVVEHKIYSYRTDPVWLIRRAFMQGVSKRGMERFAPEATGAERTFLARLVREYIPDRVARLIRAPSRDEGAQLLFLFILTAAVGLGYLYGEVYWR
ncbi:glycosyltransferase family 2 protein [Halosegnis sp.]|uniref:glycosyltransferase family 2 protein n=1 Tax=Halosegnis sp. TaxID=2864959 RepID=UPI0035D3EF5B